MEDVLQPRPCERQCAKCRQWLHHSRFRSFKVRHGSVSNASIGFKAECRACEQIERNEKKNADRPKAILESRAAAWAAKLAVTKDFMWVNMNWASLLPVLRAMLQPGARCMSCGHPFVNERDVQFEHNEPPRQRDDWARHHARNIRIACQSCNGSHGHKPYAQWLDEQEAARISNDEHRVLPPPPAPEPETPSPQLPLFA